MNIEKRLANTEAALVALVTLLKDTLPPTAGNDIDNMMSQYFEANRGLGAFQNGEYHPYDYFDIT